MTRNGVQTATVRFSKRSKRALLAVLAGMEKQVADLREFRYLQPRDSAELDEIDAMIRDVRWGFDRNDLVGGLLVMLMIEGQTHLIQNRIYRPFFKSGLAARAGGLKGARTAWGNTAARYEKLRAAFDEERRRGATAMRAYSAVAEACGVKIRTVQRAVGNSR